MTRHTAYAVAHLRGTNRPAAVLTAEPVAAAPAREATGRHRHKEVIHLDGASPIETGRITAMDERAAVALRAAIDDAVHSIAARFSLTYHVERGCPDGGGCDYRIRLVVKAGRRARTAAR